MAHLTKEIPQSTLIALGRRNPLIQNVEWRHCDFGLADPLDLQDVDVVVHLAAEKRNERVMEQVNVAGTRQLVEAMRESGVKRLVHLSSVGVYGAGSAAGVVNEAFIRTPKNEYERTKATAEVVIESVARQSGLEVLVLQPTNVLAVDTGRHYPLLGFARAIARGRFAFIGQSAVTLNYIAVQNICAAIECGIKCQHTGVFILNTPIDLAGALDVIADELDLPYPQRRVPRGLALIIGVGADAVAKITRRPLPFSMSRVRELTNSTVFDGSRASLLYGGEYPVSIQSALAGLMGEYRAAGLV
jgi:nucleoside-diphosphate-sugar epimerase